MEKCPMLACCGVVSRTECMYFLNTDIIATILPMGSAFRCNITTMATNQMG